MTLTGAKHCTPLSLSLDPCFASASPRSPPSQRQARPVIFWHCQLKFSFYLRFVMHSKFTQDPLIQRLLPKKMHDIQRTYPSIVGPELATVAPAPPAAPGNEQALLSKLCDKAFMHASTHLNHRRISFKETFDFQPNLNRRFRMGPQKTFFLH